jgi:uncharacterized protein YecE (DUF72 family)
MARIHIGTSGWVYPHWRGPFYPTDMKADRWLPYYARHFHTVEVNNSFYKLPTTETFAAWRDASPPGFLFAVKGSRFITHMKKLKVEPGQGMYPLLERVEALGEKLGPILFQLPPRWRFDAERLATFLSALPTQHRYTFEFRDLTWLNEEAYDLLRAHGAAFCIYDLSRFRSPSVVTADFVYIRLHGPGEAYQGSYDAGVLADWADACVTWATEGKDVYCYFDNDQAGHAVHDALRLQGLVDARSRALVPD